MAGIFFTVVALSALVSIFVSVIILDRSTDRGFVWHQNDCGAATVVIALVILARTTETA